jgi:hypothetical protein
VPSGWRNDEDLPGNFLLYRVQDDQTVGGGSYLGIYQNVAAAAINCTERPQPAVGRTPRDLVAWYLSLPELITSKPTEVTIGGLRGYQLDIDVASGKEKCSWERGAARGTPLIIGGGVSSLHHVATPDVHVRLIILAWQTTNVTVEITGAKKLFPGHSYPQTVQPILESLEFST